MRVSNLLPFLVLGLLMPVVSAEFGPTDADGWPINVDGESTNPMRADPVNQAGGATLYPYYPILTAEVQRLADDHPDKVRLTSAGKSTAGLDLWMLEIADFDRIEAGEGMPLADREVVWVDGGTHSNEYSGVYFTLAVAQFLLDGSEDNATAQWIIENRHTWIMPMVNPDGSNVFGRLNANLVNINRNYPVVWDGQGNDALMNNRGPYPASELETQITIDWYNKTHPDYFASIHCCGNLWLYPYGEEGVDPPDQDMLQIVCDEAFPDVREACGPIWSTIYPASGSSVDTAYEYTGAVSFGYEMSGRGAVAIWGQPITYGDVFEQERESWFGLKHAFMNVHKYGGYPEVVALRQTGEGLAVTLQNAGRGNITFGMAHVDDAVVDLPHMEPGQTATVVIPTTLSPGEADLVLHYQKRVMGAPIGERILGLAVADNGEISLDGAEIPLLGTVGSQDSPAIALLGVLAALCVALILVRRR